MSLELERVDQEPDTARGVRCGNWVSALVIFILPTLVALALTYCAIVLKLLGWYFAGQIAD
jgi:hypothetical protein